MKKIAKKVFKIGIFSCLGIMLFAISYAILIYAFSPVKFDKNKIINSNLSINLFDSQKRRLNNTFVNGEYVSLEQIPTLTLQCFISTEDKNFYKHHGLNYKRMLMATFKNIASFSFKEGASTISQQLIKNTHLSNEKSIKRKINEIKLTKQLERDFTKSEILEYYLNAIYFGDNCYGIQNASEHYFSKSVSKLTLDESAVLAGMIKSPNKYHPIKQHSNCINRRNVVLNELYKDNVITQNELSLTKNNDTKILINTSSNEMNSYAKATIIEAENILNMPAKQIAISGYRIYTYMNKEKQEVLENIVNSTTSYDSAMISLNTKRGYVEAYAENSSLPLINVKRQPASAIKPALVYAPAINENIISPSTIILDEKISVNGYEPQNIGGKEYGYVDVKTALSSSLNIPAVKILSYIGIDKAKAYMERQNVKFDSKDDNLALALGGMTYGMTLQELTNCYQTLANQGKYIKSQFINYIVDKNGSVIYKNASNEKTIYRDDTAFLVTDMLHNCAQKGTAKLLSDLNFYVSSKTGTSSISKNNIDAYNISYTSEDVVGCWIGNLDNSPIQIVGGGMPTAYVKKYFVNIYKNKTPPDIKVPSSIVELEIDCLSQENEHIVYEASKFLPERYRKKAFFSRFNLPKQNNYDGLTISPVKISGTIKNEVAYIYFNAKPYNTYNIYKIVNGNAELIDTISEQKGNVTYTTEILPNVKYSFFVTVNAIDYSSGVNIESAESNIVELYYDKQTQFNQR